MGNTADPTLLQFAAIEAADPLVYKIEIGIRYRAALVSHAFDRYECARRLLYPGEITQSTLKPQH